MPPVNLFPCLVTAPDGVVHQTCRVISGPDGTQVWAWDRDLGDARVVVSSPFAVEQVSPGSRNYRLGMQGSDAVAQIKRSHSCGCGHPMKRWRPPRVTA